MSNFASAERRAFRCRRGVAALEFAVVAGLFFIAMLAAIEVGRYYMTIQGLRNFIADAGRYGIVNMTNGQNVCRSALVNGMGRAGVVGGLVSTTPGVCVARTDDVRSGITTVTVTVTTDVTYNFLFNVFGIGSQRFQDTTTVTYEL